MAEFCLDCWNKLNETQDRPSRWVLSWGKELCEECAQYKRVLVAERLWSRTQRLLAEAIENIRNRETT